MAVSGVTRWYWREREKLRGEDFGETNDGRSEFVGWLAPEAMHEKYVGREMPVRRHS